MELCKRMRQICMLLICIIFQNILFSRKKQGAKQGMQDSIFYAFKKLFCIHTCLNVQRKMSGNILKNGNNHTQKW